MTTSLLRRWIVLTVASCFVAGPIAGALAGDEPLDPLTPAERTAAARIATKDSATRKLLGRGKTHLVYVEFVALKPTPKDGAPTESEPRIGRHAEVLYYRFDKDIGVRSLVDLESKAVVDVVEVDGGSVPLTREDLDDAVRIALKNEEVRRLLGEDAKRYVVVPSDLAESPENAVRALLVHATSESDPCWHRRCAQLFFQRRDAYLTDSVVVDLTAKRATVQRGTQ